MRAEQKRKTGRPSEGEQLHTFAVCAYRESPFLEDCVRSLLRQTVKSRILIATSTPNDLIRNIAEKYDLPLYIREGESDIRSDWNFAFDQAKTPYVTIAHQDDLYHQDYVKVLLHSVRGKNNVTLFFSDYLPIRHGIAGEKDLNFRIRRLLRLPIREHGSSRFWKRAILSLGNSICCPTVTYCRKNTGPSPFSSELKFNIDWDTFYKFAGRDGEFVYYDAPLAFYRIHDGATSKEFIVDHQREKEDRIMFRKYWPAWLAELILYFYRGAYKTYD